MYNIKTLKKGSKTFYEVTKNGDFYSSHTSKQEAEELISKAVNIETTIKEQRKKWASA